MTPRGLGFRVCYRCGVSGFGQEFFVDGCVAPLPCQLPVVHLCHVGQAADFFESAGLVEGDRTAVFWEDSAVDRPFFFVNAHLDELIEKSASDSPTAGIWMNVDGVFDDTVEHAA